jgi:hypothetical protein
MVPLQADGGGGGVAGAVDDLEQAAASGVAARDALHGALRSSAAAFRSGHDREVLKTVATRDRVVAALIALLPRALGTLVRRQLGECMCVLLAAEGRALVPLLDALIVVLTKASKDAKIPGGDNIKCNTLACVGALLERFGVLMAVRLGEFYSLAKGCLKAPEDAAVRAAAVGVIVAIVRHGGQTAHAHHEDALKLCKGLLQVRRHTHPRTHT